jgi:hypothetical protein
MGSLLHCIGSLCPVESHPTVPGFRESLFAFVVLDRFKKDHQITLGSFGHRSAGL